MADDQTYDPNGNDADDDTPDVARDTDGRGSANQSTDAAADPNVEAVTGAFEGRGASDDAPASGIAEDGPDEDGPDAVDLEDFSGGSRREPGR